MSRFKCNKKEPCVNCAGCCHFREKQVLSDKEDFQLRKQMWDAKSILYLYPFFRYTISLSNNEKIVLEKLAKKNKVEIKILPKKIMLDEHLKTVVLDWFVDADVCPFLTDKNLCLIYKNRPMVCKTFPKDYMPSVDVEIVVHSDISFEDALSYVDTF